MQGDENGGKEKGRNKKRIRWGGMGGKYAGRERTEEKSKKIRQ